MKFSQMLHWHAAFRYFFPIFVNFCGYFFPFLFFPAEWYVWCICALPLFVIYADKRVRHDACVPLEERYEDLLTRYGRTEAAREGIRGSYEQGKTIERALSAQLGWALHEDSFDCGRLVQ